MFNDGTPVPKCIQNGCTHDAVAFCVYGCLEGHIYEGHYCHPCMMAKRERIRTQQYYSSGFANRPQDMPLWACENTQLLVDFAWVILNDPYRAIFDADGERILY